MMYTRRSAPARSSGRGLARAYRKMAPRTARWSAFLADSIGAAGVRRERSMSRDGAPTRRAAAHKVLGRTADGRGRERYPARPDATRPAAAQPHLVVRDAPVARGLRLRQQGCLHEPEVARGGPAGRASGAVLRIDEPRGRAHDDHPQALPLGAHADARQAAARGARGDLPGRRVVHLRRRPSPGGARVVRVAVQAAAARAVVGRAVRERAVVPAHPGGHRRHPRGLRPLRGRDRGRAGSPDHAQPPPRGAVPHARRRPDAVFAHLPDGRDPAPPGGLRPPPPRAGVGRARCR